MNSTYVYCISQLRSWFIEEMGENWSKDQGNEMRNIYHTASECRIFWLSIAKNLVSLDVCLTAANKRGRDSHIRMDMQTNSYTPRHSQFRSSPGNKYLDCN